MNQWSGIFGRIIAFFTKHRGIFHSIVLHLAIFLVMTYFFGVYYGRGLFLGYLAHLIGDGVSRRGILIFYPFSKFKIKGPLKVGGIAEWLIMGCMILIVLYKLF